VRYSPAVYSAFAPPPKLQLSTWMEEHIRLPAGDAAVPGKIRLYGYQRGIADAIGDPLIERVTVIKSARIGYTTLLVGALANYVHNDPSSLLCLLRSRTTPATLSSRRLSRSSPRALWFGPSLTPRSLTLTIGTRCCFAGLPVVC
jgi:phage terminase large subunit GpA-like protein